MQDVDEFTYAYTSLSPPLSPPLSLFPSSFLSLSLPSLYRFEHTYTQYGMELHSVGAAKPGVRPDNGAIEKALKDAKVCVFVRVCV